MDKCSTTSVTCSLSCGSKKNARLFLHSFPLKFERGSEISSTVIGRRGCVFGADLEGLPLPLGFQCNSRLWVQVEVQEPALIGSKVGSSLGAAPIQRSTSEVRPVRAVWWRHSIGEPSHNGDAAPTLKGVELKDPSEPLGVTLLEWIMLRYSWQGVALRAFYVQVGDSFQSRILLQSILRFIQLLFSDQLITKSLLFAVGHCCQLDRLALRVVLHAIRPISFVQPALQFMVALGNVSLEPSGWTLDDGLRGNLARH